MNSGSGGIDTVSKLRLAGVKIKNYRSFLEFPGASDDDFLEIGDFTTLIGRNDVGKSNFLRAIVVALRDLQVHVEDFHKDRHLMYGVSKEFSIMLKFVVPEDLDFSRLDYEGFKETYLQGECGDSVAKVLYRSLRDEGFIIFIRRCSISDNGRARCEYKVSGERIAGKCLQASKERLLPAPIYIGSLHSLEDETSLTRRSLFNELFTPLIEDITTGRGKRAKKIRDLLKREVQKVTTDVSKDLSIRLKKVWDYVEGISIDINDISLSKSIRFTINIRDKDIGEIPISQKGMGIQRETLVEFFDIYRRRRMGKGHIFIIEEPEIFLHPGAQRRFMTILREISKEGQILISTHSSIFVDNSDLKYTYLLKRKNGRTTLAVKPQYMNYLSEIARELDVKPSDALLSNGIIIVEGPSDRGVLGVFAKSVYGPEWDLYNLAILPLGGSNISSQKFGDLKRVNPNIAIIVDADIEKLKEDPCKKKRKLCSLEQSHGIPVYFWKKRGKYVRELGNLFTLDAIKEFVARRLGISVASVTTHHKRITRTADVPQIINEIMNDNAQRIGKPANYDYNKNKGRDAKGIAKNHGKQKPST